MPVNVIRNVIRYLKLVNLVIVAVLAKNCVPGSDKRKATSQEEIQRMFQSAGLIYGDKIPVPGTSLADLDLDYFKKFYENHFNTSLEQNESSLQVILQNMNLMQDGVVNTAGILLFAKSPEFILPVFIIKAVAYPDNKIHATEYLDSRDISGRLADIFQQAMSFVAGNIFRNKTASISWVGEWDYSRTASLSAH